MKCSHIPCDKDGIHHTTVNLGFGMVGEAYYCYEHLPSLEELKENEIKEEALDNN
jgi:hypothetical protein